MEKNRTGRKRVKLQRGEDAKPTLPGLEREREK